MPTAPGPTWTPIVGADLGERDLAGPGQPVAQPATARLSARPGAPKCSTATSTWRPLGLADRRLDQPAQRALRAEHPLQRRDLAVHHGQQRLERQRAAEHRASPRRSGRPCAGTPACRRRSARRCAPAGGPGSPSPGARRRRRRRPGPPRAPRSPGSSRPCPSRRRAPAPVTARPPAGRPRRSRTGGSEMCTDTTSSAPRFGEVLVRPGEPGRVRGAVVLTVMSSLQRPDQHVLGHRGLGPDVLADAGSASAPR